MKRQMKVFLGLFVCAFMIIPFVKVNAAEYDQNDFGALIGGTPITSNDTLTVNGAPYIGANGALTINDGNITFSIDNNRIVMTIDGNATLNDGENFFVKVPDALEAMAGGNGFALVISEGSTFNINGTVIIPAGSGGNTNGLATNNGTVNVNGTIELRSTGSYTGTGTTNVNGNFVVYGLNGTNLGANLVLNENGSIYSDSVLDGKVTTNVNGMQISDKANKDYDSVTDSVVTANGDNTFAYAYELSPIEEVVAPDNTTTPEDTTSNAEEVTNPKTADSILLITLALLVSGGAAVFAGRKIASQRM